jgi:hypothetical protein
LTGFSSLLLPREHTDYAATSLLILPSFKIGPLWQNPCHNSITSDVTNILRNQGRKCQEKSPVNLRELPLARYRRSRQFAGDLAWAQKRCVTYWPLDAFYM